ncbi:hypothetical protein EYF80_057032 [Liparis tanakae]|uniref:Uncharacterized protein n=1 Tax=Liparis tanakae TaxID=230148 RepID=A0A4Z2EVI2_9TELE|nr:hypothetical protein EYF80_057032 [Liparis tanakae]
MESPGLWPSLVVVVTASRRKKLTGGGGERTHRERHDAARQIAQWTQETKHQSRLRANRSLERPWSGRGAAVERPWSGRGAAVEPAVRRPPLAPPLQLRAPAGLRAEATRSNEAGQRVHRSAVPRTPLLGTNFLHAAAEVNAGEDRGSLSARAPSRACSWCLITSIRRGSTLFFTPDGVREDPGEDTRGHAIR